MAKTPISRSDLQASALAEMGDKLDEKKGDALKVRGFARAPKGSIMRDSLRTPSSSWHGMGPQGITYVNPVDDPRKSN
jgi:hypothetical protein